MTLTIRGSDVSLARLLARHSLFALTPDDMRDLGLTPCRSLAETAVAFHAWRARNPTR